MNPFSQLHELPRQLRHPAVRDLAWTLLSAPLLQHADWPQRHPLSASTWAQTPGLLADWLRQQVGRLRPGAGAARMALRPVGVLQQGRGQ